VTTVARDGVSTEIRRAWAAAALACMGVVRQSHAVRISFIPMIMKSPGLKPIEAQNARSSSACVPYLATMRHKRPYTEGGRNVSLP
jgi:hypothetical protein